jgi:hypothetical protein
VDVEVVGLGQVDVEVVGHQDQGRCHFGRRGQQLVSSPACCALVTTSQWRRRWTASCWRC